MAITLVRPGLFVAQSAWVWVTVTEASTGNSINIASAGVA